MRAVLMAEPWKGSGELWRARARARARAKAGAGSDGSSGSSGSCVDEGFVSNRAAIRRPKRQGRMQREPG
ncbi:hypothetical protein M0802_009157 [Mischocyttarus mexicanus]|nr:hypothetical protein M0802_009157 [Mischocyttarus mexicanus]